MAIGINSNLLETNIINLVVVVGVVIYLGGDVLKSLLAARKDSILQTLNAVEEKYKKTLTALKQAETDLEAARKNVKTIQSENQITLQNRYNFLLERIQEDLSRLENSQKIALEMEKAKIGKKLYFECTSFALNEAKIKVQKRLKVRYAQQKLITTNISILLQFL
jgi:F-type H+-transporting ATPase subunit b